MHSILTTSYNIYPHDRSHVIHVTYQFVGLPHVILLFKRYNKSFVTYSTLTHYFLTFYSILRTLNLESIANFYRGSSYSRTTFTCNDNEQIQETVPPSFTILQ